MIGFEQLNPMQQEAVKQKDGAVLILAGAGSGKTGALTVRIADMLEIKEKEVLNGQATSFTAAKKLLDIYFNQLKK